MTVHDRASVDPSAKLGARVSVGPFCIIGPGVTIGDGSVLVAHVTITGPAIIGKNNIFHPTCAIGGAPQDQRLGAAEGGSIEIGDNNVFREAVQVHAPKVTGGKTQIGNRNRFFFSSHIAHDCVIGDDVVLDSGFGLSGHAHVESGARCGPHGGVHQFTTIGRYSLIRSHTAITMDVAPYMDVDGNHFRVIGVNEDAVKGLPPERYLAVQDARVTLFNSGLPRGEAIHRLEKVATPEVREIIDAVRRSMKGKMGRALEAVR